VIGWTMLIFGIVLYWADRVGPQTRRDGDWTLRHAILMGLWQAWR
jgi:undecaprenyl-diphosphatase